MQARKGAFAREEVTITDGGSTTNAILGNADTLHLWKRSNPIVAKFAEDERMFWRNYSFNTTWQYDNIYNGNPQVTSKKWPHRSKRRYKRIQIEVLYTF